MDLTVGEIARAVGGEASGGADEPVRGVTWDSRQVAPGNLYVCLPGERVDGHDYARDAVTAGAGAVLAARPLDVDAPVIVVRDTQAAFTELARHWRGLLSGVVVGITGSSGKTTTKGLVRDVLSRAGSVVATRANQNNELGVPATLLAADRDTDYVVVEMGMRGLGQIAQLCDVARPDWGLVTNVGESHIELLGSRANIARAKSELVAGLAEGGVAFVNAADDFAVDLCRFDELEGRVRYVFFEGGEAWPHVDELGVLAAPGPGQGRQDGQSPCGDGLRPPAARGDGAGRGQLPRAGRARTRFPSPFVYASDVRLDAEGRPSFTMCAMQFADGGRALADGACACSMELRGLHNVSNACSAAAVGLMAGLTLGQCCEALAQSQPEQGRQRILRAAGGLTVVDDAYNANPDSMGASLSMFAAMDVAGKRIAVLGDMLELGDFARDGHERMGRLVHDLEIDVLVCVGALSRDMARAARDAGMTADAVHTCDDAQSALEAVCGLVDAGDAVLVKASHSIGLDYVVEGLVG